jgi:hypothetical protein
MAWDFVSIYLDGATLGVYIAQVTAVAGQMESLLYQCCNGGHRPISETTGRSLKQAAPGGDLMVPLGSRSP